MFGTAGSGSSRRAVILMGPAGEKEADGFDDDLDEDDFDDDLDDDDDDLDDDDLDEDDEDDDDFDDDLIDLDDEFDAGEEEEARPQHPGKYED
jgi:hypothetical protein